jgi:hypothetical protein
MPRDRSGNRPNSPSGSQTQNPMQPQPGMSQNPEREEEEEEESGTRREEDEEASSIQQQQGGGSQGNRGTPGDTHPSDRGRGSKR